jgi:hypothetical protein
METARMMWTLFEPVHTVTYFHPRSRAAFEAAGLRGFFRGYFAGRAAPLGPVDAAPVTAAFFNFAPATASRALPAVWELASPAEALRVRTAGAIDALSELTAGFADVDETADLMAAAVAHLDHGGRVLSAANAALAPHPQPLARLWHAATVLREHRGDGHVAALVTAGLDGCETLVWRAGIDLSAAVLQRRGWTDEEWRAAATRLVDRGLLGADGRATEAGLDLHRAIEDTTDRLAAAPWDALGPESTERLRDLLTPITLACRTTMPPVNPIGLPAPLLRAP